MKKIATYLFRMSIVTVSFYFLGKELWHGSEGIEQCRILRHEISLLVQKRERIEANLTKLNKELALLNDPEFFHEYSMRKKDLKQKGDIVYLI